MDLCGRRLISQPGTPGVPGLLNQAMVSVKPRLVWKMPVIPAELRACRTRVSIPQCCLYLALATL